MRQHVVCLNLGEPPKDDNLAIRRQARADTERQALKDASWYARGAAHHRKARTSYSDYSIEMHDIKDLYDAETAGSYAQDLMAKRDTVRQALRSATKVMLIVHGHPDDGDAGFHKASGEAVPEKLPRARIVSLLCALLPAQRELYLTLAMCCAAWTPPAERRNVGAGTSGGAALEGTFSYRLFRHLATLRPTLTVVAFTGIVNRHDAGGRLSVMRDADMERLLEQAAFRRSPEYVSREAAYDALCRTRAAMRGDLDGYLRHLQEPDNPRRVVPASVQQLSDQEREVIRDVVKSRAKAAELQVDLEARKGRTHYGKILYRQEPGRCIILSRGAEWPGLGKGAVTPKLRGKTLRGDVIYEGTTLPS